MRSIAFAAVIALSLLPACDDDDDACTEEEVGCPCDTVDEVICRRPGPDLLCDGEQWLASFDGPCGGLDAGN
jgi:hypothetical protein